MHIIKLFIFVILLTVQSKAAKINKQCDSPKWQYSKSNVVNEKMKLDKKNGKIHQIKRFTSISDFNSSKFDDQYEVNYNNYNMAGDQDYPEVSVPSKSTGLRLTMLNLKPGITKV